MSEENQSTIMTDTQPATDVLSNEVRLDDEHEVTEDGLFIIDQGSNGSGHTSGTIDINKNRSQDKEEEEEELTYDDDEYVINQDNSSDDDFEGEEKSEAVEEDDDEVAVVLEVSKDDGVPEVLAVSEVKHEEEPDQEEKASEDQQLANPESKAIPEIGTLKDVSTEEQAREEGIEIIINEDDEKSDYAETPKESVDDIEMIPQSQQTEQKSTEHEINEDLDDVITLTEDPEFAQPTESATTTTTVTTTAIDDHKIPIYLTYSEHKFLLFPFEQEQDLPYIFEDFDQCYKPIEDFFVDIRENHQFNEIEPILVSEELILTIPQFESLRMTEDNVYCRDISIGDFVNLFKRLSDATKDKTKVPSHLTFELTTQPRFITKYNSLVDDSQDTTNGGFDQIDNNEEPESLEEEGDDEPITKKRRIE